MGKECYQENHVKVQTPCFKDAGSKPCSAANCLVYDEASQSSLARALGGQNFLEYIANNLLHYLCRMSKFSADNAEFKQRTGYKG